MDKLSALLKSEIESKWPNAEVITYGDQRKGFPSIGYAVSSSPPILLYLYDRDPENIALSLLRFDSTKDIQRFIIHEGRIELPQNVFGRKFFQFTQNAEDEFYPLIYQGEDGQPMNGEKRISDIIEEIEQEITAGAIDSGG